MNLENAVTTGKPKTKGEIAREFDTLIKVETRLQDVINGLVDRLQPILSPSDQPENPVREDPETEMAKTLKVLSCKIDNHVDYLLHIIERVEL